MTISIASSSTLSVPGNGKVVIEGFVVIRDDGQVVSSMSGVFDFTKIPAQFHTTVINHLLRNRLSMTTWEATPPLIQPPPVSHPPAVGPSTPAAALATIHHRKPWWNFWS
jgi:hypothetical protein